MFINPYENQIPDKTIWDNLILYDDGYFYAFFGTGYKNEINKDGYPRALDIAKSADGVHWEFIARNTCYVEGAHAGFGVQKIGEYFYYYPTASDGSPDNVHFKIYRTKDFTNWEYMGKDYDVYREPKYYANRWEEMMILRDTDKNGKPVMYGYISTENNLEYSPSAGMLKSYDGIDWEILPPVIIDWGETPAQHGEVNFAIKKGDKYYLSICYRFYMGDTGFCCYTFSSDSPYGPFRPDLQMFRLAGNSGRKVTFFTHSIEMPDGETLAALWLSKGINPEIPSKTFAVGSLKKIMTFNGYLRLSYFEGTDNAKGREIKYNAANIVHPSPEKLENLHMNAGRSGTVCLLDCVLDIKKGFIIEGYLNAKESRSFTQTHQHSASAGFYLEQAEGVGYAVLMETLGVTRGGLLEYGKKRICEKDIFDSDDLVTGRSEPFDGKIKFSEVDKTGPFGHASYCGIRHGENHNFRLLARENYFELFIDNLYVQTYIMPEKFSGRAGFCVFNGKCEFNEIKIFEMNS